MLCICQYVPAALAELQNVECAVGVLHTPHNSFHSIHETTSHSNGCYLALLYHIVWVGTGKTSCLQQIDNLSLSATSSKLGGL